jgi:hypothetical protein
MGIFRKGELEEFDDSVYYADDPVEFHPAPDKAKSPLKFGFITFVSVLGVALGANLLLNLGSDNKLQFGQGITQTITCQGGGSYPVTITPYAGFQNANGTGKFTLDSILIENINQACVTKDFIVRVYTDTGTTPLTVSDSKTSVSTYDTYNAIRFYWSDSVTVTSMGTQYTDTELLNDTSTATDFTSNSTSFLITFDPDQAADFADATQVYKITLETAPHTGATS